MLTALATPAMKASQKPDRAKLYLEGLIRNLTAMEKGSGLDDKDALKRTVFFGVRYFARYSSRARDAEILKHQFGLAAYIQDLMGNLTPRDLVAIFPIDKKFDGEKYETKDYFFTMDALTSHGMDTELGESGKEVLYDYTNLDVRLFVVRISGMIDDMRRAEGKPGMIEEFFGIKPTYLHKDEKGRQYIYDPEKQTTVPVKKKLPRHLRPVK